MNNFFNLIRNEHMKIYKKVSSYIMMGLLILIVISIGLSIKVSDNISKKNNKDLYKNEYKIQINNIEKQLKNEKLTKEQNIEFQQKLEYYNYCLNNNIPKDSWKNEVVNEMLDLKTRIENSSDTAAIKKLSEKFTALEKIIKTNDWKQFQSSKKVSLQLLSESGSTNESLKKNIIISIESIDLRLKYNISPDSSGWQNSEIKNLDENKNILNQIKSSSFENSNPQFDKSTLSIAEIKKSYENKIEMSMYRIENNIAPTDAKGTQWEFMKIILDNLLNVIVVFVVIVCSAIVAGEFTDGTIKQILIRPYKRWEILLSKYLTIFIYTFEMMAIMILTSYIVGGIINGFSLPPIYLYMSNTEVITQSFLTRFLFETVVDAIPMIMVATLAFMISTVFKNNGLSIGMSLLVLFLGGAVVQIVAKILMFDWAKYILFANWNIVYYFTEGNAPLVKGMNLRFSLAVLAAYFILFNLITFFSFTKRDVKA